MENVKRQRWFRIGLYVVILVVLSIGLTYLLQFLLASFDIKGKGIATTAYLVVFLTTLVCNAGIMVPVAIHISVMMAAASQWNPALVALIASVAGTLGEITGYYAGYLGKKIMFTESTPGYDRFVGWMKRYGPWAVFVISLQPVLPVDIAGLTAGVSRMPLWKFLSPCWAGKFPKYLLFCYFSSQIFRFLPSWF
ncbi:MAG: VTT domain-containing protein [Chloroflexota bacterium]|nr:VTT domain-containing protein [Chloroflexota bacterium]